MNFYTTSQLGPSRHMLKNGTLLCKNVPIARTGRLLYKDHEIDIKGDANRVVRIDRSPDEVFSPTAIDSFNGAAVTLDHPPEPVTPRNWSAYAKGTVTNARRGTGSQSDLLIADLLITDGETIRRLMEGPDRNPQVSSGYECDYEEIGPALGRQVGIIGNHVAFVKAGRAGPRCSVGDSAMPGRKIVKKTVRKHVSLTERLRTAFEAGDGDTMEMLLEQIPEEDDSGDAGSHTHIHLPTAPERAQMTLDKETMDVQTVLQTMDARMTTMEATIGSINQGFTDLKTAMDAKTVEDKSTVKDADPDKDKDADKDKKDTKDSQTVPDADQQKELTAAFTMAISRGEILAPGVKMITFDSAASMEHSIAALHAFRLKALGVALANDETAEILSPIATGVDLTKLTTDAAALLFTTASELVRAHRNKVTSTAAAPSGMLIFNNAKNPNSPAELNKKYAEFSAKNYAH